MRFELGIAIGHGGVISEVYHPILFDPLYYMYFFSPLFIS